MNISDRIEDLHYKQLTLRDSLQYVNSQAEADIINAQIDRLEKQIIKLAAQYGIGLRTGSPTLSEMEDEYLKW
ncbi:uncharacterized protein METZ01_LOCUS421053 [marine metagenome]|uniref:Uncharacterized protein n=1 Tax=marine metagenome TaxID=408172 RepID=A0A382XBE8_9ZZZZ